jgi:hypothetical protein
MSQFLVILIIFIFCQRGLSLQEFFFRDIMLCGPLENHATFHTKKAASIFSAKEYTKQGNSMKKVASRFFITTNVRTSNTSTIDLSLVSVNVYCRL